MTVHPTPWKVDKVEGGTFGATYIRAANGWLVAEMPRGAYTEDTARLIAAAPQLLAACKAAAYGKYDREKLIAAIAAAEGDAP